MICIKHILPILAWLLTEVGSSAEFVAWTPATPSRDDRIEITSSNCTQAATLHWGVNARGKEWQSPAAEYIPAGSSRDGAAVRTGLAGPDSNGLCRLQLGPFNQSNQPVRSVDFVVQWADQRWENNGGRDYRIDISNQRIVVKPATPNLNNRIAVSVRSSQPGGHLRWGVNAVDGQWMPPARDYWPKGTEATDDGLAVDSPLPAPDSNGVSVIFLGPFNSGAQIVTSLHMAVHWGKDWDTDLGRNYSVPIQSDHGTGEPPFRIVCPLDGTTFKGSLAVVIERKKPEPVTLWLDGRPMVSLVWKPLEWMLELQTLPFGLHHLTAQSGSNTQVTLDRVSFWYVPRFDNDTARPDIPLGATPDTNGVTSFALYAPGKHFVSLIGDFNDWSPRRGAMNCSTDGVWWLYRSLDPGKHTYQYLIDGKIRLADPYSKDVEWKDDSGRETQHPEMAKSVVEVNAMPFGWSSKPFRRPSPDRLVIYEFSIDDVTHGGGFSNTLPWLSHMHNLGVTAVEPMPFQEFAGSLSWGYNPSFHFAPESTHGSRNDLKRLIDSAHRQGMAVIMDMVLNHMDAQSSLYQLYGKDYAASPYFYPFEGENWGFPDLEQEHPAFKQYVADMLQFWLREYRVDGFRYDATRWVGWQGYNDWGAGWFAYAAKQADSNAYQIAEHLPSDPDLLNQTEMDAGWDAEFRWRIRDMLRNADLNTNEFVRVMTPARLGYSNALQRVVYTESHDEERVMKELHEAGFGGQESLLRAESALVLTLTAPGIPMLYAGQEFGESTPKIVGQNFLHWEKMKDPAGRRLFQSAQNLIRLRTTHPALRGEDLAISFPTSQTVVYTRGHGAESVIVAVNFGREEDELFLTLPNNSTWIQVLGKDVAIEPGHSAVTVNLKPGQSAVFSSHASE
ncbi:MAG TPA: hypothetical protein DCZ95_16975 [Verrucomicrobia bacterium]|nr:MAG: hypothetical protein A2X46_09465 [Lentisphaerae bacterium GWF2_57_35]HBA85778.1 hypothetical protein [Verrucomicrobiota bacterium]